MNLQNKNQKISITRRHGNPRRNLDLNKSDLFATGLPGIRSPASNKKKGAVLCAVLWNQWRLLNLMIHEIHVSLDHGF